MATAEIIDLAEYRKAKQRTQVQGQPMAMMPPMMFGWMPVWVLVPVPVVEAAGSA